MRKRKPKQKSVTFNTGYIGLTVKVAGDPFEVNVRGESFVTAWQGDTASTLQQWVTDHEQSVRQKLGGYALYEEGEVKAPFKEFALSGNVSVSSEAEDVTLQSSQLETVWGNKLEGGVSVNLYGAGKTVQFFNEADYKAFLNEVLSLKREGGTVSTPCFLSDIKGVIVREVGGEIRYEQVPYDKYADIEDFTFFWFDDDVVKFPLLNLSSGTNFVFAWRDNQLTSFPQLDLSSGTNFAFAWRDNQLTSFPQLDLSSGNNFAGAWRDNQLTSFPQLDVSSGTNFSFAWRDNQLTSFPQLDVSSGTFFSNAWTNNQLTSFPQLDVSSGINFFAAWQNNQLTSFPQLDVSSGTNFPNAWRGNQLTSFPKLDLSSGTDFRLAWFNNNLTSFPANMFDSLSSPANDCFSDSWTGTNAIDAQSVENILVSIDTSNANAPASGVDIGIRSNGDTLTGATNTAITSLKGKGWTITIEGV